MVMRGPGIAAGTSFDYPASNVDVAPTLLGLAGYDELSVHMDGRSIVPLLVDPADPTVLEATRLHIRRVAAAAAAAAAAGGGGEGGGGGKEQSTAAVAAAGVAERDAAATAGLKTGPWRTFHPIEVREQTTSHHITSHHITSHHATSPHTNLPSPPLPLPDRGGKGSCLPCLLSLEPSPLRALTHAPHSCTPPLRSLARSVHRPEQPHLVRAPD